MQTTYLSLYSMLMNKFINEVIILTQGAEDVTEDEQNAPGRDELQGEALAEGT